MSADRKSSERNDYAPMGYVQQTSRRIFPFVKAPFINWMLRILNGLVRMRVGEGLELSKAEGGWVIKLTDTSPLSDDLQTRWYKYCKNGTEYWVQLRGSQLYNIAEGGGVGTPAGEP